MRRRSSLLLLFFFFTACSKNKKDQMCHCPLFHNGHNLYVGTQTIQGVKYIYGVEFDKEDSTKLDYRFTHLQNWRQNFELKGTAILYPNVFKDYIEDKNYVTYPAYIFIDTTRHVKILFSKKDSTISEIADIKIYDFDKPLGIMYRK